MEKQDTDYTTISSIHFAKTRKDKTKFNGFAFELASEIDQYGMHGNVWEWCQDGWHRNYQGAPSTGCASAG